MKYGIAFLAAAAVALSGCQSAETPTLATDADSASYALGMSLGSSLEPAKNHVELSIVIRGLEDAVAGNAAMSETDARRVVRALAQRVQEDEMQRQSAQSETNVQDGTKYREENGERQGVQTTASGLQYEVLTEGNGPKPAATARVTVHYRGTLIDGTEFDTSIGGDPATFALDRVIPGWTEGVQLMSVGSKYRFVLPPELGYGERGSPPNIGPNSTLVFEVELIGFE